MLKVEKSGNQEDNRVSNTSKKQSRGRSKSSRDNLSSETKETATKRVFV